MARACLVLKKQDCEEYRLTLLSDGLSLPLYIYLNDYTTLQYATLLLLSTVPPLYYMTALASGFAYRR